MANQHIFFEAAIMGLICGGAATYFERWYGWSKFKDELNKMAQRPITGLKDFNGWWQNVCREQRSIEDATRKKHQQAVEQLRTMPMSVRYTLTFDEMR